MGHTSASEPVTMKVVCEIRSSARPGSLTPPWSPESRSHIVPNREQPVTATVRGWSLGYQPSYRARIPKVMFGGREGGSFLRRLSSWSLMRMSLS